jgi:hypothetical protein
MVSSIVSHHRRLGRASVNTDLVKSAFAAALDSLNAHMSTHRRNEQNRIGDGDACAESPRATLGAVHEGPATFQ